MLKSNYGLIGEGGRGGLTLIEGGWMKLGRVLLLEESFGGGAADADDGSWAITADTSYTEERSSRTYSQQCSFDEDQITFP